MKPGIPSLDEPEESQYALAIQFMGEITYLRRVWSLMRPPEPLTPSDLMLLGNIREFEKEGAGPVTISKMAQHMKQSMPGISQKASLLEKQGFLKRVASKEDRRVVSLVLTKKGMDVTSATLHNFFGKLQQVLENMGEEDAETLLCLLEKLRESIRVTQIQEEDDKA